MIRKKSSETRCRRRAGVRVMGAMIPSATRKRSSQKRTRKGVRRRAG